MITGIPTELTEWGFRENEHFIGWRNEAEIPDLVDNYLRNEKKREEIARCGQEVTLRDFTFQKCRDKMIGALSEHPKEFFAPARNWAAEDDLLDLSRILLSLSVIRRGFPGVSASSGALPAIERELQ